jgi:enoyl-CoA hydratase|tara:strand:- start:2090 stop:2785 length:696 start_codon:yes stop_codon:yes gene_type:complete
LLIKNLQNLKVNKKMPEITLSKRYNSLIVTFNRPNKKNAINLYMRDVLWEALELINLDKEINGLVFISSVDNCFSSGADINDFGTSGSIIASKKARIERDVWKALNYIDVPVLSVVDGIAYGAGAEIALASDWIFSTLRSQFALPEPKIGYMPAAGGTQLIIKKMPSSDAYKIAFLGESLSALRLNDFGLIAKLIEKDNILNEVDEWCSMLLNFDVNNLRTLKNMYMQLHR